jgi:hypothetical protein
MAMARPEVTGRKFNLPAELSNWPIEMLRIASPGEAEKLSSADWDTLKRNHSDKVVKISKRREGMRVGHALILGGGT